MHWAGRAVESPFGLAAPIHILTLPSAFRKTQSGFCPLRAESSISLYQVMPVLGQNLMVGKTLPTSKLPCPAFCMISRRCAGPKKFDSAQTSQGLHLSRRNFMAGTLIAGTLLLPFQIWAAEQGIQPSDYTVPALSSAAYRDKIL